MCVRVRVTPEYAVEVSGTDSRWLEVCSVPGCDHTPADSGHCAAGNSILVSWQTRAPPKNEIMFMYGKCATAESCQNPQRHEHSSV